MRKPRIYISGPVTGTTDYMERFARAEKELTVAGYEVINPVKVISDMPSSLTWEECMHICIAMLDICDSICMLDGWKGSKGGAMEMKHAMEQGKEILVMPYAMYISENFKDKEA